MGITGGNAQPEAMAPQEGATADGSQLQEDVTTD